MPDISPYGVTQNADAEQITANQLVGERAGNVTAHQLSGQFAPAGFSTAPYRGDRKVVDRYKKTCTFVTAKGQECRGLALKGTDFCRHHYDPEVHG